MYFDNVFTIIAQDFIKTARKLQKLQITPPPPIDSIPRLLQQEK